MVPMLHNLRTEGTIIYIAIHVNKPSGVVQCTQPVQFYAIVGPDNPHPKSFLIHYSLHTY